MIKDPNVFFCSFSRCYLCWNSLEVVCFVFRFSSFPFGKPSKALFLFFPVSMKCFSPPLGKSQRDWQTWQFCCQFSSAASSKASSNVHCSNLKMSFSRMNNVGVRHVSTCQSHELLGSHSPWQDQRLSNPWENIQKTTFRKEFTFLTFKKKLAESLQLQEAVPISHLKI